MESFEIKKIKCDFYFAFGSSDAIQKWQKQLFLIISRKSDLGVIETSRHIVLDNTLSYISSIVSIG